MRQIDSQDGRGLALDKGELHMYVSDVGGDRGAFQIKTSESETCFKLGWLTSVL
jgi:hypothetical protein